LRFRLGGYMKPVYLAAMLAGCFLVSACGGGGGSSAPPPSLAVSLSASGSSASVTEGATTATATATASVTTTGTITTPIVADLSYDKSVFSSVTATPAAGGYTLTATTQPDLGGATYASPITFRLCQEAACSHVYAGTTATYTYTLTVNLRDWTTFQREATHTGYVHTTLDPTKFKKIWGWTNPTNNFMTGTVSGKGNVYFSAAPGTVYSLSEATGTANWSYSAPAAINTEGAPAYDGGSGTVYVPAFVTIPGSTFYGTGTIRGLDAATGAVKSDSPFISQVGVFNSPTLQGGDMFFSAGYFGGVSYRYSLPAGSAAWTSTASVYSNEFAGETPAADPNYVYYSTEWGLAIYNRADGSLFANVADTRLWTGGANDLIAPAIAPSGHVIVGDPQAGDEMIAVDVASKSILWRTAVGYDLLQPAVGGSVVYAAHISSGGVWTVDAISDADGSVQWSWTLPSTDTRLIENMVVCDNLLFVSSDKNVYAIDLKTHQTDWTYAAHGRLSLSSGYVLYIVANDYGVGGNVTAVKLAG